MGKLFMLLICVIVATIAVSTGSTTGEIGTVLAAVVIIALASLFMRLLFRGMFK
jgi:hypothetical protein